MNLSPSTIRSRGRTKNTKRVGRGNASGIGNYSARGMKGQNSRSGSGGIMRRAFKAQLQKVPKSRGFNSLARKPETVTLTSLDRIATTGVVVITPHVLKSHGVVRDIRNGVKIVGTGTLTVRIAVSGCLATKTALVAIEKAGGTLKV